MECYATGKTDDEIRDMIYKLYDASMSHPFPEEWIEECLEVYQVDSLEDLHDTPWMKLIWDAADESIVQVRELLSRAAAILPGRVRTLFFMRLRWMMIFCYSEQRRLRSKSVITMDFQNFLKITNMPGFQRKKICR